MMQIVVDADEVWLLAGKGNPTVSIVVIRTAKNARRGRKKILVRFSDASLHQETSESTKNVSKDRC